MVQLTRLAALLLLYCFIGGHWTSGSWQGLKMTDGHLDVSCERDKHIFLQMSGRSYININSDNILEVADKVQRAFQIVKKFKHNDMLDLVQSLQRVEQLVDQVRGRVEHVENISGIMVPGSRRPNLRFLFTRVRFVMIQTSILRHLLMKNECVPNPCRNGGTCLDRFNGFHCFCPNNWEGSTCEVDVNECADFAETDFGCQNNAICTNLIGSYKCECRDGWIGVHCVTRQRDCDVSGSEEMCANGYCINQDGRVACLCHQGWTMDLSGMCTVDVNECAAKGPVCSHNPLVQCYNTPGSFRCGPCPAGYSGTGYQCQDINECQEDNGGCSKYPRVICINTRGSRVCGECPVGYSGDGVTCIDTGGGLCTVNNGGCHVAALCVAKPDSVTVDCKCSAGYVGDGVGPNGCTYDTHIGNTVCSRDPCKNGGTCVPESAYSYKCLCPTLFTGIDCDMPLGSPCDSKPCQNGGLCTVTTLSSIHGFKCSCQFGFTGDICEMATNNCVGSVTLDSGVLIYPKADSMMFRSHSELCHWQIHVDSKKVVQVKFHSLNISLNTACSSYVQVYDGSTYFSKSLAKLCNSHQALANVIKSTTNVISIYANLSAERRENFQLSWSSIDASCVKYLTISDTPQIIESPGHPNHYSNNLDCFWHISVPEGKQIDFVFYMISIENAPLCRKDYLKVFDHDTATDQSLLRQYCDNTVSELGTPLRSISHQALLFFHSDDEGSAQGFRIGVHAVQGCGGVLSEPVGDIEPPLAVGTSSIRHENNLYCEWRIQLPVNDKIKFWFTKFDLEDCTKTCHCDYLEIHDGLTNVAPLIGKYCGSVTPSVQVSSTNILSLVFKSDALVNNKGFVMKYETYCGGHYTESSGELLSPYYPQDYPGEVTCEYFIEQPVGKIIKLQVNDFDVEDLLSDYLEKCSFDYLEIRDGHDANTPLIGRYCGGMGKIPTEIVSKFNFLYLKFVTDLSEHMKGFRITYTTIDVVCGSILKDREGSISSPLGDNAYPPNVSCNWLIVAPIGYVTHINWVSFHVPRTEDCQSNYVQVFENSTSTGNGMLLATLCGLNIPKPISSIENMITIVFHSDSWLNNNGFKLNYVTEDAKHSCGGTYHSVAGEIKSPNFPDNYPPHKECIWTIYAPKGQQIRLNVLEFKLERQTYREKCSSDALEIRNGAYNNSPLIGQYCGTFIQSPVLSFSNALYIKFTTDTTVSFKGFHFTWDSSATGCGGLLTAPSGSFLSPNFPESYNSHADCIWRISVAAGSKIQLNILELELQDHPDCNADFVEVYDGVNTNAKRLGRYCSRVHPQHLLSSGNHLLVKFVSDYEEETKGFHMNYTAVCNVEWTGHQGVIESFNFPDPYPINVDCRWNITAPRGNNISILFSFFDLEELIFTDCASIDYLEISDKPNSHNLGKYCGKNIPDKVISTSGSAYLHFHSDDAIRDNGFRLEWFIEGCGGLLKDPNYGFFTSPGYSTAYPPNVVCDWYISLPHQYSIQLYIFISQIEFSPSCEKNSLKVYGGPDDTAPLLYNMCSNKAVQNSIHISGSHALVRFTSGSTHGGRGFTAHYYTAPSQCGGNTMGTSGQITSHNYPNNYGINEDCEWLVSVNSHRMINFTFVDFDIEPSQSNVVQIYDGMFKSDPLIFNSSGKLEELTSRSLMSTSSDLYVRHVSDDSTPSKGFRATYHEACGARIITRQYRGYLSHDTAPLDIFCKYYIISSVPDSVITLTVTRLYLTSEMNVSVYDGETNDGRKLLKVMSGSKAPPMILSTGPAMTVEVFNPSRHNFDFDALYAMYDRDCGGDLMSEQGAITSPKYPDGYPAGVECIWNLRASPGNRVMITFTEFSLEKSVDGFCNEDYVEIRQDSDSGKLEGLYCGDSLPANITVSNTLWIKFRSDETGTARGFVAEYTQMHGNDLHGPNGIIASPLYPSMYRGRGTYKWTISVAYGYRIRITISDFYITHSSGQTNCLNYLKISNLFFDSSTVLHKLCGATFPGTIISESNKVTLELNNQLEDAEAMFYLFWEQVSRWDIHVSAVDTESDNCTHLIRLDSEPGMQNYTIINNNSTLKCPAELYYDFKCIWVVESSPFFHIVLNILEANWKCFENEIKVFTESSDDSSWKLLRTINQCNERDRKQLPVIISKQRMKLTYSFTNYIEGNFKAVVKIVCGEEVSLRNRASLNTYNLPRNRTSAIRDRHYCVWNVLARPGRTIQVVFKNFTLPMSKIDSCRLNYLVLRNGAYEDSPYLGSGSYCGTDLPPLLETSSNKLHIAYHAWSDEITAVGMSLDLIETSQTCGHDIHLNLKDRVSISTPGYPNEPPSHITCIWRVIAPSGHSIQFDFNGNTEFQHECEVEYIELRDGSTEASHVLEYLCLENTAKSSLMTEGNMLYIKYFSDLDTPTSFSADIKVATCGGTYFISYSTEYIRSPNYPNEYPANSNCTWHIKSSRGNRIIFKFVALDIGSRNCSSTDYVEIIQLDFFTNQQIGMREVFCGELDTNTKAKLPFMINTTSAVVRFVSGIKSGTDSSSKRHFSLEVYSDTDFCYESYETPSGVIESPGFPRGQTSAYCNYNIKAGPSSVIKLELLEFDMDPSTSFTVYQDYFSTWSFEKNELKQGAVILSVADSIVIHYSISSHSLHHGFKAKYSTDERSSCGGDLDASGVITFPDQTNFGFVECMWVRTTTQTNTTFSVDIQGTLDSSAKINRCYESNVSLCFTEDSCFSDMATLCGHYDNPVTAVRSPYPVTKIKLRNRRLSKNLTSVANFTLTYKTHPCGGVIENVDEVNITSPGYPGDYPPNMDCIWKVSLMMVSHIQVVFEFLDVDSTGDFVSVYVNSYSFSSAHLVGKYHGTLVPKPFTISDNGVLIVFHSDFANQGKGFKIQLKPAAHYCGGIEHYNVGYLTTPGYMTPQGYPNNIECEWEIHVEPGYHIGLTFPNRFHLENSTNCTNDYIEVFDYSDNNWIPVGNKVCGRPLSSIYFNSTSNRMKVLFHSNEKTTADGFQAMWDVNCGATIVISEDEKGVIMSPNYPNDYGGSLSCRYEIRAPNKIISGQFTHFALETGDYDYCAKDNLTITSYTSKSFFHPSIRRFDRFDRILISPRGTYFPRRYQRLFQTSQSHCGTELPQPIRSRNKLILHFRTDSYTSGTGFFFNYFVETCGEANITEPMDIHIPREPNLECEWVINAPRDKIVVLRVHKRFTLSTHSTDCTRNYIRVWTDTGNNTDICLYSQQLIKLYSASNNMTIQYYTEKQPFSFTTMFVYFTHACGSTIKLNPNASPKVISPLDVDHDGNYEPDLDCQWLIFAPLSYFVRLNFTQMDVDNCSNTTSCSCDYIKIYDGDSMTANEIGTFCGTSSYPSVMSSMNTLLIVFVSDSTGNKPGFNLTVEPILSPCGIARKIIVPGEVGIITSPNWRQSYSNNQNCTWILAASNWSSQLHIHFLSLDIEKSSNCTKDHLDIFDIRNHEHSLPSASHYHRILRRNTKLQEMTVCGQRAGDYYSSSNAIQVRFVSDSETTGKGFMFEFSFADCNLNLTEPYGRIYVLRSFSACRIYIKAPHQNDTISLYFTLFDTVSSKNCSFGNIQIFDGSDPQVESKRIAMLCGAARPKPVYSTGNNMVILYNPSSLYYGTFDILYTTTDQGQGCGGRLFGMEGTLTSPLYPNIFRNASVCRWDVSVPHGYSLHFSFIDFNIGSPETCSTDYLQIGETENDVGLLRWQYCGQYVPSDLEIASGEAYIRYVTSIHNNGTGWELKFSTKPNMK